ncbi:hypothetical protein RJ640_016907 [Escallonia rubra]|uniref:Uncharacterized protein n=1 Tax=Escallonia rubra TaxID=112253 RepID=A0AA88UA96_9ASTE|nr:hypothetical protein RJ640_016907 [Escallonia rubra]
MVVAGERGGRAAATSAWKGRSNGMPNLGKKQKMPPRRLTKRRLNGGVYRSELLGRSSDYSNKMVKGTLQRFLEIVGEKRRKGYKLLEKSDQTPIPSDCASVYVGKEHEKYIIPVACLSSVWIEALFHQYGVEMQATKPMFLPCSTREFERTLELASYGKEPVEDY